MYRNHIDPKADLENENFQSELFSDSEEFSDKIKMEIFQSEKDYIGASSKMKVSSNFSSKAQIGLFFQIISVCGIWIYFPFIYETDI